MPKSTDREFLISINRAFAGAMIFSFPLMMTMEMWWLGFHMSRVRLILMLLALLPTLVGLSIVSGFDKHWHLGEAIMDTLVALAVAFMVAAVMLILFGEIRFENSLSENIGKISLQVVPAAIGAMISRSLLDAKGGADESDENHVGLDREAFLRFVGALVLGLTAAPTEEMILIAHQIDPSKAIVVLFMSLLIMYGFVYGVEAKLHKLSPAKSFHVRLLQRTVVGSSIALLVSGWILWSFGRFDGAGAQQIIVSTVILGFATNLGAAAVRVVI
jgi:putative integral membrane protein (TIGR02587 family)